MTVWTSTSGQPANPPLLRSQAAGQAVAAAVFAPVMLGLLLLAAGNAAHRELDRRRLAAWDTAHRHDSPRPGTLPRAADQPGLALPGPTASPAARQRPRPLTRYQHPVPRRPLSRGGSAPPGTAWPGPTGSPAGWRSPLRTSERADCCPARPAAVAIMPPAPGRPDPAELLLCAHHYRVHSRALAAAGAAVFSTRGEPLVPSLFLPVQASGHASR